MIYLLNIVNAGPTHQFHSRNKINYYNIIKEYYDIEFIDIALENTNHFNISDVVPQCLERKNKDSIFIFNDLDYALLLASYVHSKNNDILDLLKTTNYIVTFCELFCNDNLQTIGNILYDKQFATIFFLNAQKILLSNSTNFEYLYKCGIEKLPEYFPPYGYSPINNIFPLPELPSQPIDILIYGNYHCSFDYRINLTNAAVQLCIANQMVYNVVSYTFQDKNQLLSEAKMVIHIPSHKYVQSFPWAKVVELMSKKIFFIIEENDEMYKQGLEEVVVYYKRNDYKDMRSKISYYLLHSQERLKFINKCFDYISTKYNMDEYIPKLIGSIITNEE
jgi:hypothetical protein